MLALYFFAILSTSNYIARAKLENGLKVGYFIVVAIITVLICMNQFS